MLSGGCYGVSWNTSALRMHLSGIKLASAMGEAWQECNEGKDQGWRESFYFKGPSFVYHKAQPQSPLETPLTRLP
jgi:hypothetical protein